MFLSTFIEIISCTLEQHEIKLLVFRLQVAKIKGLENFSLRTSKKSKNVDLVSAVAGGREDHVTSRAFIAKSNGNSRFISSSNHLEILV